MIHPQHSRIEAVKNKKCALMQLSEWKQLFFTTNERVYSLDNVDNVDEALRSLN